MKTIKQRDKVKQDWQAMLQRGTIPCAELELGKDLASVVVYFGIDNYGVYAAIDGIISRKDKAHFDGEVQKRNGRLYVSFANIDISGYSLDTVLQLLVDNLQDGLSHLDIEGD